MKSIPPILLSISYIVLFLDCSLGRSKTLLIFSKFKLIGKLKRNPLNFLVKKTYLQAFLQQLRQQSYYDYQ